MDGAVAIAYAIRVMSRAGSATARTSPAAARFPCASSAGARSADRYATASAAPRSASSSIPSRSVLSARSASPASSSIGPLITDRALTNSGSSSSRVDRSSPLVRDPGLGETASHRLETCERAEDDRLAHRAALRGLEQLTAARDGARSGRGPVEQSGAQRVDDARLLLPVAGRDGVHKCPLAPPVPLRRRRSGGSRRERSCGGRGRARDRHRAARRPRRPRSPVSRARRRRARAALLRARGARTTRVARPSQRMRIRGPRRAPRPRAPGSRGSRAPSELEPARVRESDRSAMPSSSAVSSLFAASSRRERSHRRFGGAEVVLDGPLDLAEWSGERKW